MSRKGGRGGGGGGGGSSRQYGNSLSYSAPVPKFLQNFGRAPSPPSSPEREDGRAALPSRPREGQWANGSDDESDRKGRKGGGGRGAGSEGEDEDDEWGETFGGGGDEGPQVVVLKEGRHLSEDEVKRLRRKAQGLASPPPEEQDAGLSSDTKDGRIGMSGSTSTGGHTATGAKPKIITSKTSSNKRKLVGNDETPTPDTPESSSTGDKKDKKKKKKVGMLSFDEAEGE
ncbi:hypothetical protein IAU60_005814 [Kwoniella sp. DSM 27419]